MTLINVDKEEGEADREIEVLFNPTEYTIEQSNTWTPQNKQGREPEYQFTQTDLKKLSMELFFDSYEAKRDVREHTDKIAKLMAVTIDEGENGKRPPICSITWAQPSTALTNPDFPFQGVLTSLRQQFVLFDENGTPVRAKLSVTFQEYLTAQEIEERFPRRSSFPVRTYILKEGDTLSAIAARVWKKPQDWRKIAGANGIQNPRVLRPGQTLIIPAVKS
jgi:nucleoid-associated protein YgaU